MKVTKNWSYSKIVQYEQCPRKYYLRYEEKFPLEHQEESVHLVRGKYLHDLADKYLSGVIHEVPEEFSKLSELLVLLKSVKAISEDSWGFDGDWNPSPWKAWGRTKWRAKIDAYHFPQKNELHIYDWKTGKVREDKDQLYFYNLCAFSKFPAVEKVVSYLAFTCDGTVTTPVVSIRQEHEIMLKKEFETRALDAERDETFIEVPTRLCDWCEYRTDQGGPCRGNL